MQAEVWLHEVRRVCMQMDIILDEIPPEHAAATRALQAALVELVDDARSDDDDDERDGVCEPCESCERLPAFSVGTGREPNTHLPPVFQSPPLKCAGDMVLHNTAPL